MTDSILKLVQSEMDRVEKLARAEIGAERRDEIPPPSTIPMPVVPKRFVGARFESFRPETDTETYALRSVQRWVEIVAKGEHPMLALVGPQGTGKSHLLYAASAMLHTLGKKHTCFSWYKLADELRYGGRSPYNGSPLAAHEVREMLWRAPVILLDEVRPTAGTSFDDTELAKLSCHTYDSHIPVLLTTNVSPLSDVLGPPAASRFTQITLTGRDRRQTSRRASDKDIA